MSYSTLIDDNAQAQVNENTLKSITKNTNVNAQTRAQISVGENPQFMSVVGDYLYVANYGSDTVSVIKAYILH